VRAEVKSFFWVDVEDEQLARNTVEASFVVASLEIGPRDGRGAEVFYAEFSTIAWLSDTLLDEPVVSGRHHYFVQDIDLRLLRTFLEDTVQSVEGETWRDIATQLARVLMWEFEDYVPHPSFG
jgi:hypothetical protein